MEENIKFKYNSEDETIKITSHTGSKILHGQKFAVNMFTPDIREYYTILNDEERKAVNKLMGSGNCILIDSIL